MKTHHTVTLIVTGFLLATPLSHAVRATRHSSDYGTNGTYTSQTFGHPPVQYFNGTVYSTVEVCEDTNPHCTDEHAFIYGVQLNSGDPGTITSITLTASGQNGGIFANPPTYGIVVCSPNGSPAPCSPPEAPLTICANSASFVVSESGVGTSTYSQTWDFANCPAFVAGEVLSIFIDFCTPANSCPNDGTPVIDYQKGVTVSISVSRAGQFVAVPPCRLVDTRQQLGGGTIEGRTSESFTVQGNCGVPNTATVYSMNVTAIPHGSLGFLTVWPMGEGQPTVSILNSYDARVKAVAALVPAGDNGEISVYASDTTDLVLDINGYFAPPDSSTLAFYTLPPCRVADTRNSPGDLGGPYLRGRQERDFPIMEATSCNIPSTALAYSLNVTAVPHGHLGFLTVWAVGENRPQTSTLNALAGTATANAAIVQAGNDGEGGVAVYSSGDTDLVIDINGYFTFPNPPDDGLSIYPIVPCRALDTRMGRSPFSGEINPPVNVLGSSCGIPDVAQAYAFNATAVPYGSLGFLTLWPGGWGQPSVSTLNAWDDAVMSNMAIVGAGYQSMVDAYASNLTDLILDISSYFAP